MILENLNIQIDEVLLIAWFFVLGAAIGSFLNVVVYRLPKGMSLIAPSSHCPSCKHRIRWFDNIPIVSWFVLGGKCRDCRAAISARYPLVEGITAGMFALLTAVEFTFKGINLPIREVYYNDRAITISWNKLELYEILLFHLILLCTLLAAGLIELKGRHAPRRLFVPALLIGIIAPLLCPYLRPAPAWPSLADWISRAVDGAASLAAGGMLGYIAWRIQGAKKPGGMVWGLVCAGVFLGWQPIYILAFIMALIALIVSIFSKQQISKKYRPLSICLYAVTLGFILAWAPFIDLVKQCIDVGISLVFWD